MKPPPPRIGVGSFTLPTLSPREAETIIDLLGQIQAALWDAYGPAILDHVDIGPADAKHDDAPAAQSADDDLSPF